MEISILLAQKIASMLLACLVGIVVVRIQLLKEEDSKIISTLVAFVLSPCAIVSAFQIEYTTERVKGLLLAVVLAVLIHIIMIAGTHFIGKILPLNNIDQASVIYSNAGYLIIPIVYTVLGEEWVIYTSAYSVVQTILYWSHCKRLICGDKDIQWKKVFLNPNFVSIYIGIIMFFLKIRFPNVIQETVSGFGSAIGIMSMLVIGMLIGGKKITNLFRGKKVYVICFLRLVVFPMVILAILKIVSLICELQQLHNIMLIVLWASAAPVGAMVTQISQIYGADSEYASKINLVSVVFCIITMPLITYLYELFV